MLAQGLLVLMQLLYAADTDEDLQRTLKGLDRSQRWFQLRMNIGRANVMEVTGTDVRSV